MPQHVVEFALVVADARGHLGGHRLHGQDFDADIDDIADVERHVLHKEVIRHKGILAELNFDGDPLFHKIGLIVGENRCLPCVHDSLFLRFWRHHHRVANQLLVCRHPIRGSRLLPTQLIKLSPKCLVHLNWIEQHFAFDALFFGDFGAQ